jgi:hypothetical protein
LLILNAAAEMSIGSLSNPRLWKKRSVWLVAFKYYLLIALFIAAPVILTIDALFFKPFLSRRIKRQKQYYLDVN